MFLIYGAFVGYHPRIYPQGHPAVPVAHSYYRLDSSLEQMMRANMHNVSPNLNYPWYHLTLPNNTVRMCAFQQSLRLLLNRIDIDYRAAILTDRRDVWFSLTPKRPRFNYAIHH